MADFTVFIIAGADDGVERPDDTGFSASGTTLRPVAGLTDGDRRDSWHRFAIPTVATGDTINTATLKVAVKFGIDDPLLNMFCEDADDCVNLTSNADITNRTRTTATSPWDGTGVGATPTSPSFASSVQEVVDRGGWSPGNHLAVFFDGQGNPTTRDFLYEAFEEGGTVPQIAIDYTPGAGGNAMPMAMNHYRQRR